MGLSEASSRLTLRGGLVALGLGALIAVACGGESNRFVPGDDDTGSGGSSPNAGTRGDPGEAAGSGGGPATGGTGPAGGGPATGGSSVGGSSVGGSSVGGSSTCGRAPDADPPQLECQGIKSNQICAVEGTACTDLPCGIADTGRRSCNCATNWTCTACDFSSSPLRDRLGPFPACPAEAADGVRCSTEWEICGPVGTEYCACYVGPDGCLIWDCDVMRNGCWC